MLSGSESSFSESEIELSELNSNYGQQDSEDSDASSTSETITRDQSLRSCSTSEMSIRTGSTACIVLPPRPVPPPPPPPQTSRKLPDWSNKDMEWRPSAVRSRSHSTNPARGPRNASIPQPVVNRTLPAKKRSSKTLSLETLTISQACDQMSRTFSSEAIKRLLFKLPPSYPPPLPPDFPLSEDAPPSPRVPLLPRKPPLPPPLPPLVPPSVSPPVPPLPPSYHLLPPTAPPLSLSSRSLPCPPLPERVHSLTRDSAYESASTHSTRGRRCFLKRRSLILITFFSLTLSLASCLFATFGFINFILPILTQEPFCVRCNMLPTNLLKTFEKKCNASKDTDEEGKFCVRSSRDISDLILSIAEAMKKVHVKKPKPPEFKYISAHKYLQQNKGKGELTFSQLNNLEHLHGMTVTANKLQINQTGLYFVYSSVYFTSTCKRDKESSHFKIQKQSKEGTPVLLAQSSHKCISQTDRHTSYTGGIFKLSANDEIFVNVSDPDAVSSDKNSNYLGLMLINMP